MTFFRDLVADLVTKKLWPLAVALLAAIVAIPTKLTKHENTGGASTAADSAASRASREASEAQPVVSLVSEDGGSAGHHSVQGLSSHDPFAPKKTKAAKAASKPAAGDASSGSSSDGSGSGGSGGSGGATPSPTPKSTPHKQYETYHVDVRFGELGAEKLHRDLPRLSALPSTNDPIVMFVGVLNDGKTAVFLLTSEAAPHGEGKCEPSKTQCTYVYLEAGETETFDVVAGTAGLAQYELKVLKVRKTVTKSASEALSAYARQSSGGLDLLAGVGDQLLTLRYSRTTGKLYPVR